jgi:ubiquinone/menaquinone biosynthesis C-methylase UbiE
MTNGSIDTAVAPTRDQVDAPSLLSSACEPFTRSLFIEAGLRPGMRVLDAWSGAGDVAFLAREIVGPAGEVTGFDPSPATVAYANERAGFRGLRNVEFVERSVEDLPYDGVFEAVVGRFVLMYRRDPIRDLRALVRCLRPGGLVIFQELDMLQGKTVPPAEIVDEVRAWMLDTFARAGIELEMGPKLYGAFEAAGLTPPQIRVDGFMGGAESIAPSIAAHVARLLLPKADTLGTVDAEEVDTDTLEERMRADLRGTGGVMSSALLIGAWARRRD